MKTSITSNGLLVVTAETPVEAYALTQWNASFQNGSKNPSGLGIVIPENVDTHEDSVPVPLDRLHV